MLKRGAYGSCAFAAFIPRVLEITKVARSIGLYGAYVRCRSRMVSHEFRRVV